VLLGRGQASKDAEIMELRREVAVLRLGQYWGLRAIRRHVLADPTALDENQRNQLKSLLGSIGRGTDRAYEIREILKLAPGKNA
jgi:hypothetical protein